MTYLLRHEEAGPALATARELTGFFTAPQEGESEQEPGGWRPFQLLGCVLEPELTQLLDHPRRRELPNVDVVILADTGQPIGAYYVGGPTVLAQHPTTDGSVDLLLNGYFFRYPNLAAGPVWAEWRRAFPPAPGGWATGGPEHRAGWLEAIRVHATTVGRPRPDDRPAGTSYELAGGAVTDPPAFYCALGEAINGPAGYFGGNSDALRDCLAGGFGARVPFRLVWHDFAVARRSLPDLDRLLEPLLAAGVEIEQR
ncbi:barstar family protein [Streptomyces sp. NPDC127098]|uniref:barstar family protein n=1 Tax=Streptomyces sp. NPDC127098 TaxID=3347137 RepID=UPI00365388FE